jgi:glycosyltransferase involved in cell wall biosynthesis
VIEASVIIGFRDWGLDRLALALRSHAEASMARELEIIVSDYGSQDAKSVAEVTARYGAKCVRTEVKGPWSRSRALNAGAAVARGKVVITTDADILFSPDSHQVVLECVARAPRTVQLVQCRDLALQHLDKSIVRLDWSRFELDSVFRPRWGMGGMLAVDLDVFEAVRGYDERMEIYGSEDIDFANRLRRAGFRVNWIDDRRCRIYHVAHESSRQSADATSEGRAALQLNTDIRNNDATWIRNLHWRFPRPSRAPLVTVSIATYNRAEFLADCLRSVLLQSVQDFEVVVVDDGSTDNTEQVVKGFDDNRIRYIPQDHQGVSAARNAGLSEARAPFVVVQDDDDIMLPWRLAAHFEGLTEGMHGTYGGWIDFDNATGAMTARPGREFGLAQMLYCGGVMTHGSLMVRTDVLRHFGYDPKLHAGEDFNLALRMTFSGIRFGHTGHFHILRRFHGDNLTQTISEHQKDVARRTAGFFRKRYTTAEEAELRSQARAVPLMKCHGGEDLERNAGPYLPERSVSSDVFVRTQNHQVTAMVVAYALEMGLGHRVYAVQVPGGAAPEELICISSVQPAHIFALHKLGAKVSRDTARPALDPESSAGFPVPDVADILARVDDLIANRLSFYGVLALPVAESGGVGLEEPVWEQSRLVAIGGLPFILGITTFPDLASAAAAMSNIRKRVDGASIYILQREA